MIVVVSCFWNAENYIEKCINSVKSQNFSDFKMFLIDDMSTDNTVEKIKNLIKNDERFVLLLNEEKKFKLKNMNELIKNKVLINDEDIIVELDGDDWLHNSNVLNLINKKYTENKNLWLTNGSYVYSNGNRGFSSKVNYKTIRTDNFTFSHLRTWKAHLWRKINEKSFLDDNNQYFKSAPDVAYSFPLVEMAGDKHYEFIPETLLVYNAESPYNEHKPKSAGGGLPVQSNNANTIRRKPKYNPID